MLTRLVMTFILPIAALLATSASADSIVINDLGSSPIKLKAGNLSGVFGGSSNTFSGGELLKVHNSLKNNGGVSTDKCVTFVLAKTPAGGLSFITLVDQYKSGSPTSNAKASLQMSSTASKSANLFASSGDIGSHTWGSDDRTASGDFTWKHKGKGDGFAWTNLKHGDKGAFNFQKIGGAQGTFAGLKSSKTFQFVTYSGGKWQVVYKGSFDSSGSFSFSFNITPVPPAIFLGAAGLAGMAVVRRRMMR